MHLPVICFGLLSFSLFVSSKSALRCEFHVSPYLPTVFEVKQGLVDAGNVSEDGTSMICHQQFGQCATLWSFDPETNDTTILLQGCWKGNADCERQECTAHDTITHPYLKNSRFCCCSSFNCNANFSFVWAPKRVLSFLPNFFPENNKDNQSINDKENIFTIVLVVSILAIAAILISFLTCLARNRFKKFSALKSNGDILESNLNLLSSVDDYVKNAHKFSSSIKNHFIDADRLILSDIISCGRYSVVRRAYVIDSDDSRREFAVKIYQKSNRNYFFNERNVFSTPLLMPHENLIEYFGCHERRRCGEDDDASATSPQYWLITRFMPLGTLQDHLKANTFDFQTMCKMAFSVAKGLAYLHSDIKIDGKEGFHKPAIAHRDLNSRNVLMKSDGACVVADLGFALALETTKLRGDVCEEASLTEVGTIRYMAPEVLEGAVNLRDPETALKQVDVYALGLVIWEIISRCVDITGQNCPDYNPPFAKESTTTHPSLEEMQLLVCKKNVRPLFPNLMYKNNHPPLRDLRELVEDCWDQDCEARISSLCAQERINELLNSVVVDANGPKYVPNRPDSNVVDLNAINVAHCHRLAVPYQRTYERSSPFNSESTADTTVTGTTSGLGSMCLNSSDQARSFNSGSSFGYRGNALDMNDVAPLQPYQGLNPCLERNLHIESSDSSSGYSNRVVESNFDKTDPCTTENFVKYVPNALLALTKTSNNDSAIEKNERRSFVQPTTSSNNVDQPGHFNNDVKEHLLALLLLNSRDDRHANRNNGVTIQNNIERNCGSDVQDVVGRSVDSDNCETPPLSSSNISPGGSSSTSSADSAFDRRSLSVSDASTSKQTPPTNIVVVDAKKKRSSRTSLDVETSSTPLKFKRFSIDIGKIV